MTQVSMTKFIDFVLKVGSPKETVVRHTKEQSLTKYDPKKDYWKVMRDKVVGLHRSNQSTSEVSKIINSIHASKKHRYEAVLKGYVRWIGKHNVSWFEPPREIWTHSGLEIIINPELGLIIDGQKHIIKMHMKQEKLTRHRVEPLLDLLHIGLRHVTEDDTKIILLDVEKSKEYEAASNRSPSIALLKGEVMCFKTVWEETSKKSSLHISRKRSSDDDWNQPRNLFE